MCLPLKKMPTSKACHLTHKDVGNAVAIQEELPA